MSQLVVIPGGCYDTGLSILGNTAWLATWHSRLLIVAIVAQPVRLGTGGQEVEEAESETGN